MLDGMSDSIQRSRIENLHSREVDRQSPTGLIFFRLKLAFDIAVQKRSKLSTGAITGHEHDELLCGS